MIFLISPQTSASRVKEIDQLSNSFIYMVSSAGVTGSKKNVDSAQIEYFKKIDSMNLNSPRLIGFGIKDKESFEMACSYANGAIIGSAFIRQLETDDSEQGITRFIDRIIN
jgi:tryptophan synthase alpha chain